MTETTNEEWRSVAGWEGMYEVSNFGRVRSLSKTFPVVYREKSSTIRTITGRVLRPTPDGSGSYVQITLANAGIRDKRAIHRLVAEAFIGPVKGKEINHLDFNGHNNHLSNLEIVSSSENSLHVSYHKRVRGPYGDQKLGKEDAPAVIEAAKISISHAARVFGVHRGTIKNFLKRWT
jgi:hypothetical protein